MVIPIAPAPPPPPPPRYNEGARHAGATRRPDGSGAPAPVPGGQSGRGRGRGTSGRGRGRTTRRAPVPAGRGRGAGRARGRGGSAPRPRPALANDVNAPSQRLRYHQYLVNFMGHRNSTTYPSDKIFTKVELLQIIPREIYKWMCLKAYGKEDPGQEDNPTECRCSTLEYSKKALSYFMPNKNACWMVSADDPEKGMGNPTKSPLVNGLIKAVMSKETKGLGKDSKADRRFTDEECNQLVPMISAVGLPIQRLRHQAMTKFQVHLIGRADDISHCRKSNLRQSEQYPLYLTGRIRWSKNVQEERDCPQQILMGAMNVDYCVVVSLAIYLEKWLSDSGGTTSQWLFGEGHTDPSSTTKQQDKEADRCKNQYSKAMKRVIDNPLFKITPNLKGELGSHSIKKLSTTKGRNGGAHENDLDYRARWKSKKVQGRYTDTQLNWPDIKAAQTLCDRGIAMYKV